MEGLDREVDGNLGGETPLPLPIDKQVEKE